MKTMNKLWTFIATVAVIATFPLHAVAGPAPTKFTTDGLQFGKSGSVLDHNLIYDFGLGGSNPILGVDNATSSLKYSKNIFSLGDGLSSTKQFIANLGLGASNPKVQYNASTTSWEFSNDGTNFTSIGTGSGGAAVELLQNPGFESGVVQGWSNTGGTFAAATGGANLLVGRGSATFTASAGGQFFQSSLYPIPNGLTGGNCAAAIMYKGGDGTQSFEVIDGSSVVVAGPVVLNAASVATVVPLTFPCPASGSVRLKVFSASAGALYAYDQGHLGSLDLIQTSQANYFGGISVDSCSWGVTTGTFADFPATTGCVYTVKGKASAPATQIPAVTFASMPAGEYYFSVRGAFYAQKVADRSACQLRLFDGTTNLGTDQIETITGSGTNNYVYGSVHSGHLSLATAASNKTISIQMADFDVGGSICAAGAPSQGKLDIDVFYFPTSSSGALKPDQTALSWSGYHIKDCVFSNGVGSYADLTNAVTPCNIVERSNRNFGTVTSYGGINASAKPGIVFTPPKIGKYYVIATFPANSTSTPNLQYQMTDLTNQIAEVSTSFSTAGQRQVVTLSGVVTATSTSPLTVAIQAKDNGGGTGNAQIASYAAAVSSLEWSIFGIDTALPAPLLVNSVVSPSAGVETINRAHIVDNGVTCAVADQSGSWITFLSRPGTGACNFTLSGFSAAPTCTMTAISSGNRLVRMSATPTATTLSTQMIDTVPSVQDEDFDILCMGPK